MIGWIKMQNRKIRYFMTRRASINTVVVTLKGIQFLLISWSWYDNYLVGYVEHIKNIDDGGLILFFVKHIKLTIFKWTWHIITNDIMYYFLIFYCLFIDMLKDILVILSYHEMKDKSKMKVFLFCSSKIGSLVKFTYHTHLLKT